MLSIPVSSSFKSIHWGYYGEKRSDLGKQDLWANADLTYHIHTEQYHTNMIFKFPAP